MTWGKSYILLRLGRCPLALQSLRAECEAGAELATMARIILKDSEIGKALNSNQNQREG